MHAALLLTFAISNVQDADPMLIRRIVQEIDLVPSIYARGETAPKLPKFTAGKLSGYATDKSADQERAAWKANKTAYARQYPMRAAIFEAAEAADDLRTLKIPMTFPAGAVAAKQQKAAILNLQASMGQNIFKLEQVLAHMKEAGEKREVEKSKSWQADFDFAVARVQTNLLFLFEYNYIVGQIRADNLPDIDKTKHDGWRIAPRPKITVTESKAKSLAKDCGRLLKKIQEEHPGTPWAFFAERENQREIGLAWEPKKK